MLSNTKNINFNLKTTCKYQSRQEYLDKLKQWLEEARLWHGFCASFPYYANLQNQTDNIPYSNQLGYNNARNVNTPGNNSLQFPSGDK